MSRRRDEDANLMDEKGGAGGGGVKCLAPLQNIIWRSPFLKPSHSIPLDGHGHSLDLGIRLRTYMISGKIII